ncbi:S1 domain-containing RNA-binding protein [Melissococcus plutonius]|uniref:RNA binding protein, contains ribosomal protein S1 domain n=1 Tax=Melissococcus plutonius TaxID=33970 RepID=A0A2Z5Y0V2_9ENTE|nr:S1 domain-containing RNA-binding protein [Melissococcus plutonius]BAL61552.1 RNA binding protein, contains ribosomal protein S1 domain [Melissococcus plutonius DAT561]MCV2499286.1 RNA-binding protein S1 [Melissococcus plutonius]MCV2501190.1 RNA-binding protein S1 [Melissococcus plutonius]MCV2505452.1 RNA-binding protein S1 [Melissococcus plutonius]MCV2507812.1 RNA-binding protein S1 [Melissococcus plutonius]
MAIEIGAKLSGKVSGITNFGAFIDLGDGKTGLVHISEISNGFVKDIHDVLTVGDKVTVKVTAVGNDGKIGLSIRKAQENIEEQKRERSETPERSERFERPIRSTPKKTFNKSTTTNTKQDFDSLMSSFLKDSDDRLSSLRRNTEGKRGGRGGRRN